MLNDNELPLKHLITQIDGKTSGPKGFLGKIGQQLSSCENLSVVNFEPIKTPDINIDSSVISTDQKYMLEIFRAVSNGVCPEGLSTKNPGKMSHARWLTTVIGFYGSIFQQKVLMMFFKSWLLIS